MVLAGAVYFSVEALADDLGEAAGGIGLGEEIEAFEQGDVLAGHAGTVAAGVNDLERGVVLLEAFGQLAAGNAAGHDHVCQKEINLVAVLFPKLQGFDAIIGLINAVAAKFEDAHDQFRSEEHTS